MNDPVSDSPKGWAVLGEFLRKVPVVDVFLTVGHFAVRPLKFTDEVLREDWTNKAKPPWFLIQTVLLGYAFRLVTPWRFIDEQASSYTDAQKHFELATELASMMLAFFAAAFVVHLILGRSRIPFVSAF